MDLLDEIEKFVMVDMLRGVSCTYVVWCLVPSTTQYIPIRTNKDVLNIFVIYDRLIDIYLDVCDVKTLVVISQTMHTIKPKVTSLDD